MKRKEITNHAEWVDTIRKRSNDMSMDWQPFIDNIEEVCGRIKTLHERIDLLDNEIGETQGMIKNLRKSYLAKFRQNPSKIAEALINTVTRRIEHIEGGQGIS